MRLRLVILLLVFWVGVPRPGGVAQASEAQAVIDTVNALRSSRGLAPYQVDSGLMDYAQQHSDYQASIDTSTHRHSDGSTSLSVGLEENVAAGTAGFITADVIVYQIWADEVHMKTMVGHTAGAMGVGAATSGDTTYYTLNVRPSGAAVSNPTPTRRAGTSVPGQAPATATPYIPIEPLVTSTPRPDGSVYHVVGYGQTLWSIALAYGVKVDQIRAFNNMAPDSTDIYAGQRLLIRLPGTPYATPTVAASETLTATATLLATETSAASETPLPSRTLTPTLRNSVTPSVEAASPPANPASPEGFERYRKPLAIGMLILAGFGLSIWLGQYMAERKRK